MSLSRTLSSHRLVRGVLACGVLAAGAVAQNVRVTVRTDIGLAIPIEVDRKDVFGYQNGKTTFTRTFPSRSAYTLTAPATFHDGFKLAKFHHWELRDAPTGNFIKKPVGQRVLQVISIGTLDDTALASYIYETQVSVRSLGATAVPITLNQADAWGAKDGNTQFFRKFAWGTKGVQFTAPATFGGKQFHSWKINLTEQPFGQRTISIDIGLDFTTVTANYGDYTAGTYQKVGVGCLGTSGKNLLQSPSGVPDIDSRIEYRVLYAPRSASATLAIGVPLAGPITLPGTSCLVYTQPIATLSAPTTTSGYARVPVDIPNSRSLIGAWVYTQFFCFDPGANLLGLTTSEAYKTTIGGWKF